MLSISLTNFVVLGEYDNMKIINLYLNHEVFQIFLDYMKCI